MPLYVFMCVGVLVMVVCEREQGGNLNVPAMSNLRR